MMSDWDSIIAYLILGALVIFMGLGFALVMFGVSTIRKHELEGEDNEWTEV